MNYSYKLYTIRSTTLEKKLEKQKFVGSFQHFYFHHFLKRCFKNFKENDHYNLQTSIIILPLRPSQPMTLFRLSVLTPFFKFLKRRFFIFHRSIILRYIFTSIFGNYWNLARKYGTYTNEIFVKLFCIFTFFFGDSLLSFYSVWQRAGFLSLFTIFALHHIFIYLAKQHSSFSLIPF